MTEPLLFAVGELLRKEISADQLLQRLIETMASHIGAERGSLFLLDRTGRELVSVAGHLPELDGELRIPIDKGVAGLVSRTGGVHRYPSPDQDVAIWRAVDASTGYVTRTALAGPIVDAQGQLIGVLEFLNKDGGRFSEADEARFVGLAEQASAVLAQTTLQFGRDYTGARATVPGSDGDPPLRERFNGVVGSGPAMQSVFRQIRRVAPTEATVLLRGASGTGKGRVARAIHHNSRRSKGPFVHIDCTTLPEGLMENELFGHERGAFTGAQSRQRGKVELAAGGTLFLDEIGDLALPLQAKLLTVIQDRTFTRLGGSETLEADIRIVAATNADLEGQVRGGRFREDLYYRLRVVELELPALAERGRQDLVDLINYFVASCSKRHRKPIAGVRTDALHMLLDHSWPGNVRELEHCIESAVIFADDLITPSTLSLPRRFATREMRIPPEILAMADPGATPGRAGGGGDALLGTGAALGAHGAAGQAPASPFSDQPTLRDMEGRYIRHLLQAHGGNRSACARVLDIGRNMLARKIKEHELEDVGL